MKKKAFLYQQLYDDIRCKIDRGAFKTGELLPSERELGETYGVDRTTVRRALRLLCEDKLVTKLPGKGTIVAASQADSTWRTSSSQPEAPARTIGFFLPQSKNVSDKITFPTYTSLLYIVEQACSEHNMRLIYSALDEEKELDAYLTSMEYDGIVFLSSIADKHLKRARDLGIPSVLLNNHSPSVMSVTTDNIEGGACAAKYLVEHGHHRIAVLAGNRSSINCRERIQGFFDMLRSLDSDLSGIPVYGGSSWSFDTGYEETKKLLMKQGSHPTAIFACGDRLALGAIKALREAGLCVPSDVSIIGYDNSEQAHYANPKLTSIDTNLQILGSTAVRLLLACLADDSIVDSPLKVLVPPTLVEQESVRSI